MSCFLFLVKLEVENKRGPADHGACLGPFAVQLPGYGIGPAR